MAVEIKEGVFPDEIRRIRKFKEEILAVLPPSESNIGSQLMELGEAYVGAGDPAEVRRTRKLLAGKLADYLFSKDSPPAQLVKRDALEFLLIVLETRFK